MEQKGSQQRTDDYTNLPADYEQCKECAFVAAPLGSGGYEALQCR